MIVPFQAPIPNPYRLRLGILGHGCRAATTLGLEGLPGSDNGTRVHCKDNALMTLGRTLRRDRVDDLEHETILQIEHAGERNRKIPKSPGGQANRI
ncbi:MAG: hypothetical protein MI923_27475 [Phycisphaerales bacterium]|nr:hypothetical protein [Phycisphaerales bacterium]